MSLWDILLHGAGKRQKNPVTVGMAVAAGHGPKLFPAPYKPPPAQPAKSNLKLPAGFPYATPGNPGYPVMGNYGISTDNQPQSTLGGIGDIIAALGGGGAGYSPEDPYGVAHSIVDPGYNAQAAALANQTAAANRQAEIGRKAMAQAYASVGASTGAEGDKLQQIYKDALAAQDARAAATQQQMGQTTQGIAQDVQNTAQALGVYGGGASQAAKVTAQGQYEANQAAQSNLAASAFLTGQQTGSADYWAKLKDASNLAGANVQGDIGNQLWSVLNGIQAKGVDIEGQRASALAQAIQQIKQQNVSGAQAASQLELERAKTAGSLYDILRGPSGGTSGVAPPTSGLLRAADIVNQSQFAGQQSGTSLMNVFKNEILTDPRMRQGVVMNGRPVYPKDNPQLFDSIVLEYAKKRNITDPAAIDTLRNMGYGYAGKA